MHSRPVERDPEVSVLVHPGAPLEGRRLGLLPARPMREPRRDQPVDRLPYLELPQRGLLDDLLN